MESWRYVWRNGFLSSLDGFGGVDGLAALVAAMEADSDELIHNATTCPPPLLCVQDWPIEATDGIGYILWKSLDLATVGDVVDGFSNWCMEADMLLGEPGACRWFLNFWDDNIPQFTYPLFLAELKFNIAYLTDAHDVADPLDEHPATVCPWQPRAGSGRERYQITHEPAAF